MCVEPISGKSELPAAWSDAFGMNSDPSRLTGVWPEGDELRGLLTTQLTRIGELLADVSDDELEQPARTLGKKRSLAGWILHGLHDEAKHCGEMYLLLKLCRSGNVS